MKGLNEQANKQKVMSLIIVYQKRISSIINKEIIKGMGKQLKLVDDNNDIQYKWHAMLIWTFIVTTKGILFAFELHELIIPLN